MTTTTLTQSEQEYLDEFKVYDALVEIKMDIEQDLDLTDDELAELWAKNDALVQKSSNKLDAMAENLGDEVCTQLIQPYNFNI